MLNTIVGYCDIVEKFGHRGFATARTPKNWKNDLSKLFIINVNVIINNVDLLHAEAPLDGKKILFEENKNFELRHASD